MARRKKTVECSYCGAQVPVGRLACPECGSDAETGWQDDEEIEYRSVEIPDAWPPDDGDGDAVYREGFAAKVREWWWWVAVVLVVAFVLSFVV